MVRIAAIGIGSHEGFVLERPASELRAQGYDIEFRGADSVTLDDDLGELGRFLKDVRVADIVFLYVHGDVSYFRHWGNLKETIESYGIPAFMTGCDPEILAQYRYMFTLDDGCYRELAVLEDIGGDENHLSALKLVLRAVGKVDIEVPEPVRPLAQGVYVPGKGGFTLEEGLKDVGRTGKPVIMISFVNVYYVRRNTKAVDELVRQVELIGGEPLAVFYKSYPSEAVGSIGVRRIVDEYLIRDGKSLVDAVINTIGFASTLVSSPGCGEQDDVDNFFERLNVPVLQAVNLYGPASKWRESPFGLSPTDITMSVVEPEYDGQIDTVPYCGTEATENGDHRQVPLEERCSAIAEMAYRWAMLRHVPKDGKKVAVLIYMYPPRQDLAGGGYGLDTFASVVSLLRRMRGEGYSLDWVPEDAKELADRMLEGITNDDNWMSERQMAEAAVDLVSKEQYDGWFSEIAASAQKRMLDAWGETPGDIHVLGDRQVLPGIMDGNVFIGFQPDRGKTGTEAIHDPWTAPPHQYLGFYRWLRDVFKADAVVHIGTHGTLEWLPGKSAGLSGECDPDIILGRMPNINPYIIDNPGEGMQSKRRQFSVTTTYLHPAMARSGGYDGIDELEAAVQNYLKARDQKQTDKLPLIAEKVASLCMKLNMGSDLGLSSEISVEEIGPRMDALYDHVLEVKDALIKDGLHVLGEVPEGERMDETLYMLVRHGNGDVPSLRGAVAHAYGLEMEDLLRDPSGSLRKGYLNGEMTDIIDEGAFDMIRTCRRLGYDAEKCVSYACGKYPSAGEEIRKAVEFVCGDLLDSVRHMTDEITNVVRALDGEFVPPGPSGCPGRGRARILPTGRNFYSIDPDSIPWHSSWEIGSNMAEQMVQRYIDDNGVCPNTVGIILWATDTMKTGGDDVAYILKLMGLRPVWDMYGGRVTDVEVIPLEELGRPRIDVTVRISGLFRDTFPNISNLIDRGVQMISGLDEDDDRNYLAANIRKDTVEAIARGLPMDRARREVSFRIFGDPPGEYGCGISDLVTNGNWKTVDDLRDAYVKHGSSVYGKGLQGESMPEMFRKRLQVMDATVKNHNTRTVDLLDMDDDFDALGGFNAAVTAERGRMPASYMGDSSDTQNLRLRTASEEIRFVFRSKIDNPKWLEGLKRHGFAGAKELSKLFDYTMGWSATSDIVEDWMYDDLAGRFVLDEETREWVKDENPYAMIAMLARLQEAFDRGFWNASEDMLERLEQVYLEFEERIEEITDR